jgi:stringent starvation protein B
LLRAMHEWMLDNGLTPHIVVDASRAGSEVPEDHVTDGKIIFNVSPGATRSLTLGNEAVSFEARFGGVARAVTLPVESVVGIYARETGQGMIFGEDDTPPSGGGGPPTPDDRRPKLKIVK